jgi:alanine dehydrogenase
MRIGIPKEIKPLEGRVALVPDAAGEAVRRGHTVLLQAGAGLASGYSDAEYRQRGVDIVPDAAAVYAQGELLLKVKEPIAAELPLLRREHRLFSFLHLAAVPTLATVLLEKGLTALAFETVEQAGRLPLLAPMSDIAGRIAVQVGATLLHSPAGGRGLLLGGMPAAPRGRVVVLGAGEAGGNASAMAAALGAEVVVFDLSRSALARMFALGPNVTALHPYPSAIAEAVREADLLIGAVLIPGARAPRLVTRAMIQSMRPGSVAVDIAVDQGGCLETTRPTDYTQPTYVAEGVTHFAVTNMPGAVPRTASQALSAVLTPFVLRLAEPDWQDDPALRAGINVQAGRVVHAQVAAALGQA